MSWLEPTYELRKGWGHVVTLSDPLQAHHEFAAVIDLDSVNAILDWSTENSGGIRISYDTWKFRSRSEADEFIMLFKLTWD
jgi:hypothetical protein